MDSQQDSQIEPCWTSCAVITSVLIQNTRPICSFLAGFPAQTLHCQWANILVPFVSENQPSCCWIGWNHLAALEVAGASCHTDSQSASQSLEWKSAPSSSAGSEGANCSLSHHALLPLLFPRKLILFYCQWRSQSFDLTICWTKLNQGWGNL